MSNPYDPPASEVEKKTAGAGVEFTFIVNDCEVLAKGGLGNGKESVYLNKKLVSEKRTFSRKSEHNFLIDDEEIAVTFSVKNPLSNKVDCELKVGEKLIQRLRCEVKPDVATIAIAMIVILPIFFGVGALKSHYNLGRGIDYLVFAMIGISLMVTMNKAAKSGNKIVTDVTE